MSASRAFRGNDNEVVSSIGSSSSTADEIDENLAKFKCIKKSSKTKIFANPKIRHLKRSIFLSFKAKGIDWYFLNIVEALFEQLII